MNLKVFFSLIFFIIVIFLLILYWFVPLSDSDYFIQSLAENFSAGKTGQNLQFYSNMRFSSKEISYKIINCPIKKRDDMLNAFQDLSSKTLLSFYEVADNEEIFITCDGKNKIEGGMFIAGEGGPTNITQVGEFNVIKKGQILLIKESNCPNPNIAIHELLHVLGFDHADNSKDIMYPVSRCDQEISNNTIEKINLLYELPNYSDFLFENVSASMHGKYLNLNISIRNNGFIESKEAEIMIYADNSTIKTIPLEKLDIGNGRFISLSNIWINQLSVTDIKLVIEYSFPELKKENNEIILKIKE